jgi:hypothetical protein
LEDRRNVGESSYNPGDGTDQRVQSLMFIMMLMMMKRYIVHNFQGIKFNQITQLEYVGHIVTGAVVDLLVTGKDSAFPSEVLNFYA